MQLFAISCLLFSAVLPIFANRQQDVVSRNFGRNSPRTLRQRTRRDDRPPVYKISECIFATSEEGRYLYVAPFDSVEVCATYVFADPDQLIEISFEYFDVPCEGDGLVTFFDGWELKGQYFPSLRDHSKTMAQRYREFCGFKRSETILLTSQNAGMLHYRLPVEGTGFTFNVKFIKTHTPCNILVESQEGVYTLKNYKRAVNCSLMAVFPAKVNVLNLNVGVERVKATNGRNFNSVHKCTSGKDFVQIGGSQDLDSSQMTPVAEFCGSNFSPEIGALTIGCGATVVKLVSSGDFENRATFALSLAGEAFAQPSLVC